MVGDQAARPVGGKALADTHDVVSHRGEAVQLGLDEKIRERLALRGEHGEVGGEIERGGIGSVAEELHPCAEAEVVGEAFAFFARGAVAGQPELPVEVARQSGAKLDELALVFLRPEHGHVEQHHGGRIGAVIAAQGVVARGGLVGEAQRGIVDDRDLGRRNVVDVGQHALGDVAVGDDVPAEPEGADKEVGEELTRTHGADDRGLRQPALDEARVTVRHAAHAEHEVRRGLLGRLEQARREPIEARVERLERAKSEGRLLAAEFQHPAWPESEQGDLVPGLGERGGHENGMALGAATAKVVLDDKNFHCSAKVRGKGFSIIQ